MRRSYTVSRSHLYSVDWYLESRVVVIPEEAIRPDHPHFWLVSSYDRRVLRR